MQVWISESLLSSGKLYEAVGRLTIRQWIKTVLNVAGIYTSQLFSHSRRMASTSKANSSRAGLMSILNTAGHGRGNSMPLQKDGACPVSDKHTDEANIFA
ncbi:hypothetical protein PoB_007570300 [Plakobranchus ocellatus]|uniref:Uncharacterized protein n=1 Tax=Plakobranchus ocellatus TaxID=259542 RepID=A0AAV4DXW5_9GAST|nr:hypothetical protein PoB_007570300 [Plakobranchus ocellatus]